MEKRTYTGIDNALPSMFRCRHWLALLTFAAVIVLLVVWSLTGRIAENVYGAGMIMGRGSYAGVSAAGSGILASLDVRPGDEIVSGQVIGRIFSNEDLAALRRARSLLSHYQAIYEKNRRLVDGIRQSREKYSAEELKRLDASLERQRRQLAWYEEHIKQFPKLAKAGAVSRYEAADAQDRLDKRYLSIETDEADKLEEAFSCLDRIFSLEHDLFDYEVAVSRARTTVEELWNVAFGHARVISRCSGRVVNVNVDPGDIVSVGQELVRVSTEGTGKAEIWETDAYFPAIDAAKIEPGMEAFVTPSVVKVEQEGSIRGFVASVGESLETQESLERTFRSESFAKTVTVSCNMIPVRVRIVLLRDPSTPSGFAWTSGRGPDLPIRHGTVSSVTIRTRVHSPMSILLGKVRRVVFGDGIMEQDRSRLIFDKRRIGK